jgi:hypothetical protein
MKSILDQLQDDQAILAMYLADELPPGDRRIIDQRLASSAELRAMLQEMSQLQEFCQNSIRMLDERESADHVESAAMRRASRMLQQWSLRRRRPVEATQQIARPIPWLRYGLSAAAMVGLAYLVWWSNRPVVPEKLTEVTPDIVTLSAPTDTLSPDVKLKILLNTMDAGAADDAADRQIVAVGVKSDEVNFTSDVTPDNSSQ